MPGTSATATTDGGAAACPQARRGQYGLHGRRRQRCLMGHKLPLLYFNSFFSPLVFRRRQNQKLDCPYGIIAFVLLIFIAFAPLTSVTFLRGPALPRPTSPPWGGSVRRDSTAYGRVRSFFCTCCSRCVGHLSGSILKGYCPRGSASMVSPAHPYRYSAHHVRR